MRSTIVRLLSMFVLAAALPFVCSCEKEGDDPGDAAEISGDSALEVTNRSEYESTVYFDGLYIGNVQAYATRRWSVPSGTHEVMFDNAEQDNTEAGSATYNFHAGQAISMWIDWDDD